MLNSESRAIVRRAARFVFWHEWAGKTFTSADLAVWVRSMPEDERWDYYKVRDEYRAQGLLVRNAVSAVGAWARRVHAGGRGHRSYRADHKAVNDPLCPRCGHRFKWMRTQLRWGKYITCRYVHYDSVCRVIYMVPREAKKLRVKNGKTQAR